MRLPEDETRRRFVAARVARLATAGPEGQPHLVPVTFAVTGDEIVFAVDHKPKSSTDLKRLRNIEANPRVSFLVDAYDDDWTHLWWARADGTARVTDDPEPVGWLVAKYRQYRERPPEGPVVRTGVATWQGWAFAS
jgi:PPOX class probable F420-dependent enzyme